MAKDIITEPSSSDDESVSSIVNGVKEVVLKSVPNGEVAEEHKENVEVGMQCGLKNLYSGKEDKVCNLPQQPHRDPDDSLTNSQNSAR